ncbi:MAG: hypothetical protein O3A46_16210, partial [Candidatus Poribacteria bacterium]|nr:hypothetical protein [Candidatus Poribacteria bacterium]
SKKLLVDIGTRRSASRRESGTLLEGRVIDIESGKVDRLTNSDWMRGWNHWEPGQAEVVNPRRRLTETLEGVDWPHWSPDAQWVAFIKDGFLALAHVQGVSDSGRWFLYNNEPPADDIYDWSWDGRAILFNLNGHLVATTLDKDKWGEMWVVSTRSGRDGSFNTDGSRVVYTANPPGKRNRALFIVNIFGENEVQITDAPYDFVSPHWQPRPPK